MQTEAATVWRPHAGDVEHSGYSASLDADRPEQKDCNNVLNVQAKVY